MSQQPDRPSPRPERAQDPMGQMGSAKAPGLANPPDVDNAPPALPLPDPKRQRDRPLAFNPDQHANSALKELDRKMLKGDSCVAEPASELRVGLCVSESDRRHQSNDNNTIRMPPSNPCGPCKETFGKDIQQCSYEYPNCTNYAGLPHDDHEYGKQSESAYGPQCSTPRSPQTASVWTGYAPGHRSSPRPESSASVAPRGRQAAAGTQGQQRQGYGQAPPASNRPIILPPPTPTFPPPPPPKPPLDPEMEPAVRSKDPSTNPAEPADQNASSRLRDLNSRMLRNDGKGFKKS
ncbi:uncharacterized protein LTR77_000146 [Saxophila tyrrhenica]|uniref:Uncharacterized protein n=1 Tax=Saxophila tyrrhenica TaxID=1690608 RepID=A0AAV9PRP3_9PEZI|nr:hypothetical protein LTR77_000146 [Saxophila tyrrhenica]